MNPYFLLVAAVGWWVLSRSSRAKAAELASASEPEADDDAGVAADADDPPSVEVDDGGGDAPRVVTEAQAEAESAPPAEVPRDTAQLVAYLLGREAQKNWKSVEPRVAAWQRQHTDLNGQPLKDDGMFGPMTALALAYESGTVPVVRYWPKGSQSHVAIPEYKSVLYELADEADSDGDTGRAAQLRASAQRERGQGYGTLPPADIVELDFDSLGDDDAGVFRPEIA